jgi:glucose-1-phosphate thymidylyltransferase
LSAQIAYRKGFIDREQLKQLARELAKTSYGEYLLAIAASESGRE